MKNLILSFFLTTSLAFAQELKIHHPENYLETGLVYYLFGDDVKFRSAPNINSEVIKVLNINTGITVLEKTNSMLTYNGIESPFYKVKYDDKVGYILGALIAFDRKQINNTTYLFGYKQQDNNYTLMIRSLDKSFKIMEEQLTLSTYQFSLNVFGSKGIEGVDNILLVDYFAEACAVNGGGVYYFNTLDYLIRSFDFIQVVDGGVYWFFEELIFPEDENGIPGKIVYNMEKGEYKDEQSNWVDVLKRTRELNWADGELLPKLASRY